VPDHGAITGAHRNGLRDNFKAMLIVLSHRKSFLHDLPWPCIEFSGGYGDPFACSAT
jgi:hypothetical protein